MKSILLLGLLLAVPTHAYPNRLINGNDVTEGWRNIFYIRTKQGTACTATLVGPKVILTAAHCVPKGSDKSLRFELAGKKYVGTPTVSPLYPSRDHDVALAILDQEITDVEPAVIGGNAVKKMPITLFGYGCTHVGGTGGNDGVLRRGNTEIIDFANLDMISKRPGGAALCFGDSGGPAFFIDGDKRPLLLGVNSKGNISDTSYNTRTDIPESTEFFTKFAKDNQNLTICGINSNCTVEDPKPKPSCRLGANPQEIEAGTLTVLKLLTENAVSAKIEGVSVKVPVAYRLFAPQGVGQGSANAEVVSAEGEKATCSAAFNVVGGNDLE